MQLFNIPGLRLDNAVIFTVSIPRMKQHEIFFSTGRIRHFENMKSYMSYLQQYTTIIKMPTSKTYFRGEIGSVVSEEKIFFKFHSPFFLFLAWWPSWLEVGITGHNFGRGPSKDHSTKVWLQLPQWFLRRRFLCEFPIGSYVKLSSAMGAILI